jgi:hypothetical protein
VEARELAGTLAPFWARVAGGEQPHAFLSEALRVAHGLDEPATAAMLLKPFRVERLTRRHAAGLTALVERYGEGWAGDVLQSWFGRDRQSMEFAFDLWAHDDVSKHADAILARLRAGTMPCDCAWPDAQIDAFQRWIDAGKLL